MNYWTTKNKIAWTGGNFQEWFGDTSFKVSKKFKYELKTLEKPMNDKEILETLKPKPITLGDLAYALTVLGHNSWYLFYIKDELSVLRAVNAHWLDAGWYVVASKVVYPGAGFDGFQVFSRNFDSQTPSPSDTLTLRNFITELETLIKKYN